MKHIKPDMSIHEIFKQHPEVMPMFKAYGLGKFEDPEILNTLGPLLKLKTVLKTNRIDIDRFVSLLNKSIDDMQTSCDVSLTETFSAQKDLTMIGLMPCGLKMPFSRTFEQFAKSHPRRFRYLIEGNVNLELSYYAYIDSIDDIDELPDIIVTSDINSFFHKRFVDRFIKPGYFVNVADYAPNPDFADIGYPDPERHYTMLSANLLIMVVDHTQMGNRPIPKRWSDLLKPEYENSVAMRGQEDFFCNAVLLPFYREHGIEGIKEMGRSVVAGMHPAEMVKNVGRSKAGAPAIYIMPHFFAQKIQRTDKTTLIWPEDGAIVSPVLMMVKRSKMEAVKDITSFISGPILGQVCADAYFPSVHPKVKNHLKKNQRMKWIGWAFLKKNDIGAIKDEIESVFRIEYLQTKG